MFVTALRLCAPSILCLAAAVLAADGPTMYRLKDSVDHALNEQAAKKILAKLATMNAKTVGVGTFVVRRGEADTFRAGSINASMAERLLVSLAREKPGAIRLATGVGATAAKEYPDMKDYSGLRDRDRLMKLSYPVFGGKPDDTCKLDALILGYIEEGVDSSDPDNPEKSLEYATLVIQAVHKNSPGKLVECSRTSFRINPTYRVASGQPVAVAVTKLGPGKTPETDLPTATLPYGSGSAEESAVEVKVLYDGVEQQKRSSEKLPASVKARSFHLDAPPGLGVPVKIEVTNRLDEKIGVVVTVNGLNTFGKDVEAQPLRMTRWVLDKGGKTTVAGFTVPRGKTEDGAEAEFSPFVGVSPDVWKRKGPNAPADALGLISVHVIRSAGKPIETPLATESNVAVAAMVAAVKGKEAVAVVVKRAAEKKVHVARGVIGTADTTEVRKVKTDSVPDPVHAETLQIRYIK